MGLLMPPAVAIEAELRRLYPAGYRTFTFGGKRTPEPVIYACAYGWRVNVDGCWHLFGKDGTYASSGYRNRVVSRPRRLKQAS